jgi:hypothetical protein
MKPVRSPYFRLEKLYLDCIDHDGNCFIVYHAKLEFAFLRFFYSGVIFSDNDGKTFEHSSLGKSPQPSTEELLIIDNTDLKISGEWRRDGTPVSLILFRDRNGGALNWNCHHPKAFVEIKYDGRDYKGYGYAETLLLAIPPWRLPIDELRWGRFLSIDYSVTWIKWSGGHPLNIIICNGEQFNDSVFEDERILFGNGKYSLMFRQIMAVRQGTLSDVLSGMRFLKMIVNRRILSTVETKFKAESLLVRDDGFTSPGWALYEIVSWGK